MMQTARDKIRELRALYDDGLLSQQEFDLRKNAILDAEYAPPSGAPVAPRAGTELGLMAGQEIGPQNRRYRLERLIGAGSMGQVWQATDLATHAELGNSEMVALKILPPQLTRSASHARLLIEEATQARKLAHEHIVRVYEWAQDPATASYFIIMECLDGQDLERYLSQTGPLALSQVQELLLPVADALSYAWEKNKLVHRDIKPGNVFLTRAGDVKLLDFGIASRAHGGALQTPNAGTSGYRAPEAGSNQEDPSPRLDVFAVAVMIYQMLEGRMPFDEMRSSGPPRAPAALNYGQWQVLQNGFANAPELRPASVGELLEALQRAAGPSAEEQAALDEDARERTESQQQEAAAQAEQMRLQEQSRQTTLTARRQVEAQAAAIEQLRLDKLRREQEGQRRIEAEAAAKVRKANLRAQLQARREADAAKARVVQEEQLRKIRQAKAEAFLRAEQERSRRELAEHNATELAQLLPSSTSPVAGADGVLRDRFRNGSGSGPDLVLIPTGRFEMGSSVEERAIAVAAGSQKTWLERETPQHWVAIEYPFAMGRYPVTVGQWRQFARATGWQTQAEVDWQNPGFGQSDFHPVVGISWHDAQRYLDWLNQETGQGYRLPSEAEWEYACRAGTKTAFSFGDTITTDLANYDGNYTYNGSPSGLFRNGTSEAGSFGANPWGLFEMHGNVWEWVQDVVHDNYDGAPNDGSAWQDGGDQSRRILRGGSWLYNPRYLRSALRNGFSALLCNDIVGFRVARRLD